MNKLNEKIKSNLRNIKPKSRFECVSYDILKDILLLILIVFSVLMVGILIYNIRQYNPWDNLPNNFHAHMEAVKSLPWELTIITVLLIIAIILILKKINNFYRINLIFLISAMLIIICCGYLLAEHFGIHEKITTNSLVNNIYKKQGRIIYKNRGAIVTGQVMSIKVPTLVVVDMNNKAWHIETDNNTKIASNDKIENYDFVLINGIKIDNNIIKAFLIKEINEKWRGFYKDVMNARSLKCPACTK